MPKFIAVSVKDSAAATFGPPFFVPNAAVAVRSFANEVNRMEDKNPLFTNPEHFELYQLGSWDDETGFYYPEMVDNNQCPKLLARAQDHKRVIN